MLLKFTTTNMFNTFLIDVATGERAYEINTISISSPPAKPKPLSEPLSSSKTSASSQELFPVKDHYTALESHTPDAIFRQTQVRDAVGAIIAEIQWEGRCPHFTINGQKVGGLNDLFGTSSVRFMPKILAIPTKYDPDYIWTATQDSLKLVDYATDEVKGTFHQNVLRLPCSHKVLKSRIPVGVQSQTLLQSGPAPLSPKSLFKSPSRIFSPPSSSPSSILETILKEVPEKFTFLPIHIPGLGSNFLEFTTHPKTNDVEIILSFLIMEILRRGRFNLTPYTFDNPPIWQLKEARNVFLRRMRRNTV